MAAAPGLSKLNQQSSPPTPAVIPSPEEYVNSVQITSNVSSVTPADTLEHVRAFSQSRGWSEAKHEAFVQNLRKMGLSTWREAMTRELDER